MVKMPDVKSADDNWGAITATKRDKYLDGVSTVTGIPVDVLGPKGDYYVSGVKAADAEDRWAKGYCRGLTAGKYTFSPATRKCAPIAPPA